MLKYTLIGHPLGHSMSPFIHQKLFELSGVSAEYNCTDIVPDEFDLKVSELSTLDGFNITIPYKTEIIPHLDIIDDSAKRYKSVNCVHNNNGRLVGYNTDCEGFLRSLKDFPLNKNVLLLGCGGVGRMIAIEAVLHGANLTIAIIEDARKMAVNLLAEISEISPGSKVKIILIDEIKDKFDLLINATPVGMYPESDACPVSEEVISNCENIFDVIYNPVKTKLITTAEKLGKKTIGGMGMLVLQAVKAHEIWYNSSFTNEQIDNLIAESERKVEADFK
jgi:shikimate dehydrogenase